MAVVDLSAKMVGSLPINLGGRIYTVRPPSAKVGEVLMKILALGFEGAVDSTELTAARIMAELGESEINSLSSEDYSVDKMALGGDVFNQMWNDDIPLPDIQMAGRYAAFFWVFGKEAADKVILEDNGQDTSTPAEDVVFPKPWRSGPSTESETPSPTEPSLDTTSLPTSESSSTSGKTPTRKKTRASKSPSKT